MAEAVEACAGGCVVLVKAVPGARREGLAGVLEMPGGARLKVRVAQPAEGGKANRAIETLLARTLGVRPAAVRVVAGTASAEKSVRVEGVDAAEARRALGIG
jgi:uncharacterized protein YggU (UPF0235/DUF167 family)